LPFDAPSSSLPPRALALAVAVLPCLLLAVTLSEPPSVSERSICARVWSWTMPLATAMPSAKLLPLAAPSALVAAVPA